MTDEELLEDKRIMDRLHEQLDIALNRLDNPEWVVIGLCGSQNYGLADEYSDIDSKLLLLPSMDEIVFNQQSRAGTCIMENNEHVVYHDIRDYIKILYKCNINFVELLFTKYYIVNPKWEFYWEWLRTYREEIGKANIYRLLKCCQGNAHSKGEKDNPTGKDAAFVHRMSYFVDTIIKKRIYAEALYPNYLDRQELLALRHEQLLSNDEERKADIQIRLNALDRYIDINCQSLSDKFDSAAKAKMDMILICLMDEYLDHAISRK